MKNCIIYSDNLIEADWFQNLSPEFKDTKTELIKQRNKNIPIINELVDYDRPDIILLDQNQKPLLVLEKTEKFDIWSVCFSGCVHQFRKSL